MAKRKAGDIDRWVADVIGGKRAADIRERARKKDRKQDQKKGAQAKHLIEKRAPTTQGDR